LHKYLLQFSQHKDYTIVEIKQIKCIILYLKIIEPGAMFKFPFWNSMKPEIFGK
jgi:hypothetical protein